MIYLNVAIHVEVFARITQAAVLNQGSTSVNCLNGVGRDGDLVAVDEEDAADVKDLFIAEFCCRE